MGKIRTKALGLEEVEKEQAEKAKARREGKKAREAKEKKAETPVEAQSATDVKQKSHDEEKQTKSGKKNKKTAVTIKKHGTKYEAAVKKIDAKKTYDILSAVKLLRDVSYAQFDQTVELHLNLTEDGIKGDVTLPHGTGKAIRVVVVDDNAIAQIAAGTINFDILIAHPSYMPKLARYAKTLGPRGLMPNPKAGTVTEKTDEALKKFAGGVLRYKSEAKFPLLHQAVGKMSFTDAQLVDNIQALLKAVAPKNISSAFISASMTPSVRITVQ